MLVWEPQLLLNFFKERFMLEFRLLGLKIRITLKVIFRTFMKTFNSLPILGGYFWKQFIEKLFPNQIMFIPCYLSSYYREQ